jgi:hypothetical protein
LPPGTTGASIGRSTPAITLIALADHAGPGGTDAFPSVGLMTTCPACPAGTFSARRGRRRNWA